ncbi:elongation of very long chain fatty acids protein 4-like isoform X1 [Sitophilus oryzae]|uniref:Elongation of very long chain fatty acids protein n=1 Tax=Sitophilus oryzae TaxID=7048 RepID=A0A6J2XVF4_SITOR|nr:elongation of very long chain fatty acids protein 4-like isoform X1 [Sitophilus oryzae]
MLFTDSVFRPLDISKSYWNYVFYELADSRTKNLFLVSSPATILLILGSYLYFVLKWGPEFMKNRKPYELKKLLMVYNVCQIIVNVYIFLLGVKVSYTVNNFFCMPIDYTNSELAQLFIYCFHIYFINKVTDLLDTVFFVLRKKSNQISFLHLWHHCLMVIVTWMAVKYIPGGQLGIVGLVNSFVHIILYSYYFLAALGPSFQKYLWWKKYLTRFQLIQFCLIFLHSSLIFVTDCDYPKWAVTICLPNAIFFYYLFYDFYKTSYTPQSNHRNGQKIN